MWKYFSDERPENEKVILFAYTKKSALIVHTDIYIEKGKCLVEEYEHDSNVAAADNIDGRKFIPEGVYALNGVRDDILQHYPTAYAWMPVPEAPAMKK